MSETEIIRFENTITNKYEIKHREIDDNLHVFAIWEYVTSGSGDTYISDPKIIKEGFVDDENLAKLKSVNLEIETFVPSLHKHTREFYPAVIYPKGLELIREKGHPLAASGLWEELLLKKYAIYDNFITAFENGASLDDLHFLANHDHSFVDINGRPVAHAICFEYIDAGLSNEVYDLEKVVEFLSNNPEVEFLKSGHGGNGPIHSIPYYNVYEARDKCVYIMWRPTKESWDALLEQVGTHRDEDGDSITHLYVRELMDNYDVLGLTAAGCRLESPDNKTKPHMG